MQRQPTTTCPSCEQPLVAGSTRCACGAPTDRMDHAERNRYEVEQWRAHRARQIA